MFFAAKEAVERRAKKKGRQEGIREGKQAERERINKVLAEAGVPLTPELIRKLSSEDQ